MRKIIALVCTVATLLFFGSCQAKPAPVYTHGVYELSITASLLFNHSVGNEWQKTYTCEGESIVSGKRWTVPLDTTQTVTVKATITEKDKWPDSGSVVLTVTLKDGFETTDTVTVVENKGRYKGDRAQWAITCNVKLVEKREQTKSTDER